VEAVPQRTSVRPADMKPPPKLVAQRQNPASYTVEVGDATDDFVVGFADSFAPGWTLRGLPQGWSATHVELDGYANGWAVRKISARAPSRLHLTVEHRPSVLMRLLLVLPVGAVLALILVSRRRRHGPAGRENPCAS
jgi:arabinofuranan 3-O-arabinosyltransferase